MVVVGYSQGWRVKKEKKAQHSASSRLCHKCQSVFYERGEEFKTLSVPSPKDSVEELLYQLCFIGGQSEIQVLSLPSSAAVGPDRNTWRL